ncbi:cyclic nucleotide-binding domain-containing protein [Opitutus sp. GAS368]|jgi:CRP/FNR family cyclic AMP-dependent transcriptional regulator|uniref:cyclic nucleotide-binding domain-containing protein n=1 Tax=Opitutus sp. GAS368 TaxID=1882749 RepID=UPI00087CBF9C|nr:cyclic nucleotide-binding domain-containing protein [Opitutus sp. GAS368]SDR65348.1 Cyclic nucleotide-binding domain-containing protein [Opitutus sp. GAS368]
MKIKLFNTDTEFVSYSAGQTVFREGDGGELMFAVIEGAVEIHIKGKLVETIEAGGVFGEMALIESRPRIATALVKTDAKLVPVDRKRFEFLVQQSPFFALQLMTIMAARLRRMDEKL